MLKAIQNELDRRGFCKRWRVRYERNADSEVEWCMPLRTDKKGEAYPYSADKMAIYTYRRKLGNRIASEVPEVEIYADGDFEIVLHMPNSVFEQVATLMGVRQRRVGRSGNVDAFKIWRESKQQVALTAQIATKPPEVT